MIRLGSPQQFAVLRTKARILDLFRDRCFKFSVAHRTDEFCPQKVPLPSIAVLVKK
jgi:hypothetical protein